MKIAVIGAGSWGTALAWIAANKGHEVKLWARRESVASNINVYHKNPDYLSAIELPSLITASDDLGVVVGDAQAIIVVTPSKYLRTIASSLKAEGIDNTLPLLICTKGVEEETGFVPVELFTEVVGNAERLACLSGPNHAEEVVEAMPTGTVVASLNPECAKLFQELLGSPRFRVYTSTDTLGVELCAAAKNVMAIAVGISYGLGFGDNTAAMLMTRGQAEMGRLVEACGGQAITCMGLAGTGDLIATCMSQHSRNRAFGEAIACGENLEDFERRLHMVVEGALACRSLRLMAARVGVEVPIMDAVYAIVWEKANPKEVGESLALRRFKPEFY